MQEIETGRDKVKKICDALKKETLEPAKQEALKVVEDARKESKKIIDQAKAEAAKLVKEATLAINKEKELCQASLQQAYRQVLETLRQAVEKKLFNHELKYLIAQNLQDPNALAQLISVLVKAIVKEGLDADLHAYLASSISPSAVTALLAREVVEKLKDKTILLSSIGGGVELKLKNENLTIDITDETLKELMAAHIHKNFREVFFGS